MTLFYHFGSKENLLKELLAQESVLPSAVEVLDHSLERPVEEVIYSLVIGSTRD